MKKNNKGSSPKNPVIHYTSVIAEVGYNQFVPSDIEGADNVLIQQTAKVQFFSQSDKAVFPLARMAQLQQNAADMVINSGVEKEHITNVFLTNIIPLGWMTETEFRTPGHTKILNAAGLGTGEETPSPIEVAEAAAADSSAPVTDMLDAAVEVGDLPAVDDSTIGITENNVTPIR